MLLGVLHNHSVIYEIIGLVNHHIFVLIAKEPWHVWCSNITGQRIFLLRNHFKSINQQLKIDDQTYSL